MNIPEQVSYCLDKVGIIEWLKDEIASASTDDDVIVVLQWVKRMIEDGEFDLVHLD